MRRSLAVSFLASLLAVSAFAYDEPATEADDGQRRYTFSWLYAEGDAMAPRGGTTKGPEITLAPEPSAAWQALQETDLTPVERDRRAIRALAGAYRTSFDFIETIGFTPGYEPSRPYQSWGTEYVYIVADEPEFISLQHILVMRIRQEDGTLSEPMVIKHWRHDWTYEDRDLHEYAGHNSWRHRRLSEDEASGTWSQAVFQVDDSPRYETFGRWVHEPGYSHWETEATLRPLPRREFSVRDDYHALAGTMRISVTPSGWVMEEDALKLVLTDGGEPRAELPYLARESGISRYEHITGFDFSAGDAYWQETGPFWAEVRRFWSELYASEDRFALHKEVDGTPLFRALFSLADAYRGASADASAIRTDLTETLAPYVRTVAEG